MLCLCANAFLYFVVVDFEFHRRMFRLIFRSMAISAWIGGLKFQLNTLQQKLQNSHNLSSGKSVKADLQPHQSTSLSSYGGRGIRTQTGSNEDLTSDLKCPKRLKRTNP